MDPMDSQAGEEIVRTVQPQHRLVRTGGRGEMRRNARLAHAPKPSGGWQTVRGGGSVDHLYLWWGEHVGSSSFLFFILSSLLSFSLSSSFPRAPVKVDPCTSCISARYSVSRILTLFRAIESLMSLRGKLRNFCAI